MSNALFIGWNRAVVGKEKRSLEQFQEFLGFLKKQQDAGVIKSFSPCTLQPHGGDLNGFILIQGEPDGIFKLMNDDGYLDHVARGTANLNGMGALVGYTGKELESRLQRWTKFI